MTHLAYVLLSYGICAATIAIMIAWVLLDQRARLAELAELEARGVKRRSDPGSQAGSADV